MDTRGFAETTSATSVGNRPPVGSAVSDRSSGASGPLGKGGGAVGIIVTLLVLFLGGRSVLGGGGGFDPGGVGGGVAPAAPAGQSLNDQAPDPDADLVDFVTYVFDDVQSFWGQQLGGKYQPADLVLFSGQTQSGCGLADAGHGSLLLPRRHDRSTRPRLLPRAAKPLRCARRLRAGVRHRARDGPSRAEPRRHQRQGEPRRAEQP